MTLRRGQKDTATDRRVSALQVKLVQLGYALPRWGADGDLGDETLDALNRFLDKHGAERDLELDPPDVVSDEELAILDRVYGAGLPPPRGYVDRRRHASLEHDHGQRRWTAITGIAMHQTACRLGERPGRWDTVGAHVGVTPGRQIIHLHDFDRVVWHGNGLNARCIGIEGDGLYAGVEGDPRTVWDDPDTTAREVADSVTDGLVEAYCEAIRWCYRAVEARGGRLRFILAHRQASKNRRNDPGSGLWQRVAIPMMRELGLEDGGPGFKIDNGYPVPAEWDSTRAGYRY